MALGHEVWEAYYKPQSCLWLWCERRPGLKTMSRGSSAMTPWPWLCKPEAAHLHSANNGDKQGSHVTGGADEHDIPNVS